MTTREKLEGMLVANGMSESQAKEVMDIAIPQLNEIVEDYSITWDRDSFEYPSITYPILFQSIKPIALTYIEDKCPNAWFRPMFFTRNI